MKEQRDNLEYIFKDNQFDWDLQEVPNGHEMRFIKKQKYRVVGKRWVPISVAASIILLVGISTFFNPQQNQVKNLALASVQTREADSVFTSIINVELQKLKSDKSPENKKIINDALKQMIVMDADYEKIKQEMNKNGENSQIIYAMISNLQIRISFLENVMKQIEKNNNLKNTVSDENTI